MNKKEALNRLIKLEAEAAELRKIIEAPDKSSPEERFWQLLQGIEIKTDFEKYPNRIFGFKGRKYWGEYDFENNFLWLSHPDVWSVFEKEYDMNYHSVQVFIKNEIEHHFKCKGVTPDLVRGT